MELIVMFPLLIEAISFVFEEGKKFLQERRERQKKEAKVDSTEVKEPEKLPSEDAKGKNIISSKDAALTQKIEKSKWIDSEAKVKHLMDLLKIQTRNYYHAKEQYAQWGNALVPQIIIHNLSESENELAKTLSALQTELGKVYGKEIVVPVA